MEKELTYEETVQLVVSTLEKAGGNVRKAATALKINASKLRTWIRENPGPGIPVLKSRKPVKDRAALTEHLVSEALLAEKSNVARAAKRIGCDIGTLYKWLKAHPHVRSLAVPRKHQERRSVRTLTVEEVTGALTEKNGNVNKAAHQLNVSTPALYAWMKTHPTLSGLIQRERTGPKASRMEGIQQIRKDESFSAFAKRLGVKPGVLYKRLRNDPELQTLAGVKVSNHPPCRFRIDWAPAWRLRQLHHYLDPKEYPESQVFENRDAAIREIASDWLRIDKDNVVLSRLPPYAVAGTGYALTKRKIAAMERGSRTPPALAPYAVVWGKARAEDWGESETWPSKAEARARLEKRGYTIKPKKNRRDRIVSNSGSIVGKGGRVRPKPPGRVSFHVVWKNWQRFPPETWTNRETAEADIKSRGLRLDTANRVWYKLEVVGRGRPVKPTDDEASS